MKKLILIILSIFSLSTAYAQIAISSDGSVPHSSAILDVKSNSKAFYPPRMTTAQKEEIVGKQTGALVFDITLNQLSFYNGLAWENSNDGAFKLPYFGVKNENNYLLYLANTNTSQSEPTIYGATNSSTTAAGIFGSAVNSGPTNNTTGILGTNKSLNGFGYGVKGVHEGAGVAGYFSSALGTPILAEITNLNPSESGPQNFAIRGINKSTNSGGIGIYGSSDGGGAGVVGLSVNGNGVSGRGKYGIYGVHNTLASGAGVYGYSGTVSGTGVIGKAVGNGTVGIFGSGGAVGVSGETSNGGSGGFFTVKDNCYGDCFGYALTTGFGNVGIGVNNPSYILDTKSRVRIRHTIDDSPDDNSAGIWYNNSANVEGAFSGMKTDTQVGLFLGGNWRFWVNSDGQGYLNGALIQTSDKRLKKDFTILNNSLSNIYKLNGYHFRWIEEARNKDIQTGFIAQEVQKIFPELVQTDDKGFLSVNYIGLIPHLLEAVKELKKENDSLKTENNSFKNNQTKLESRVDKMETLLNSLSKNTASN